MSDLKTNFDYKNQTKCAVVVKETESLLWDYLHHDYISLRLSQRSNKWNEWNLAVITNDNVYNQQKELSFNISNMIEWDLMKKKFKREINQGGVSQWYCSIGRELVVLWIKARKQNRTTYGRYLPLVISKNGQALTWVKFEVVLCFFSFGKGFKVVLC